MFTKARNKQELVDETRYTARKKLGLTVSDGLVNYIINSRSNRIREAMENKVPRIIIPGIGSFKIKQGKNRFDIKKGREYYVKKMRLDNLRNMSPKFVTTFKVVGDEAE